jgi:hypothetical protein
VRVLGQTETKDEDWIRQDWTELHGDGLRGRRDCLGVEIDGLDERLLIAK